MHTTGNRKPRMLSNDVVSTGSDEAARDFVLTLGAPKVILIKLDSKRNPGLSPQTAPTPEQLQAKRTKELAVASKLGIDPDAYRDRHSKTHNGKHLIEGAARVRLDQLVADLVAAGYKLTAACWFQKSARPGKKAPDPTQQFTFSLEGEAIEMTKAIRKFFYEVYVDNFHLWCNPKMVELGEGALDSFFRLDTLNGFVGHTPKDPASAPGIRLRYAAPTAGESGYDLSE